MFIIAGLGNIGDEYRYTRHNIGFLVLEELQTRNNIKLPYEKKLNSFCKKIEYKNEEVILCAPAMYMNNSGQPIKKLFDYYKIKFDNNLLVIVDDFNLPFGQIRIRQQGGHGGHNGLKSIINSINSKNFYRLRVGIGRDRITNYTKFVLSKFSKTELKEIQDNVIPAAADAVEMILTENIDIAMNKYN